MPPEIISCYKFGNLTSVDVERSFSIYKTVLTDRRTSYTPENIEMYLVTNWFNNAYYFEQTQRKTHAKCKKCGWEKSRGKDLSTKLLRYHLEKTSARVQVAEYVTELPINVHSDPYKYWYGKFQSNKWNLLWPLVKRFHGAPCGSVESERLFSQAKLITTDLRNCLSEEHLKKLLYIHENLPLLNFEY